MKYIPQFELFDSDKYQSANGKNLFEEDSLIKRILRKYSQGLHPDHKEDMFRHIHGLGKISGFILNILVQTSHKDENFATLTRYNTSGQKINRIDYCAEQNKARKIAYEYGVINLDKHPDWKYSFPLYHKMALLYILNQNGEAGINQAIAITDSLAYLIQEVGTEEQKKKYLPQLIGLENKDYFTAGEFLSEKRGSSFTGSNRTIAQNSENIKWILNGEKNMCSNPGNLWLTTARLKNTKTLGLFLASKYKEDGSINGYNLLKVDPVIGAKSKLMVEATYENLEAEMIGRPNRGITNLDNIFLDLMRIHTAIGAIGITRRSYLESYLFCTQREIGEKKFFEYPTILRNLAEIQIFHIAVSLCIFKNIHLFSEKNSIYKLLSYILNHISTSYCSRTTRESMNIFGSNGVLDNFSCLPRLHNDALIAESVSGSQQLNVYRAIRLFQKSEHRKNYLKLIEENISSIHSTDKNIIYSLKVIDKFRTDIQNITNWNDVYVQTNAFSIVRLLFHTWALSEIISEYKSDQSEIFSYISKAFAELTEFGLFQLGQKDSIFNDIEIVHSIVKY